MNFTQKKRIKGKSIKTYKEWWSDCGEYRITWRKEFEGIEVDPGYFACVRCVISHLDQTEYWGFAHRRGLNRTLKAAKKSCEEGKKVWERFLSITGRAKVTQYRRLKADTVVQVGRSRYSALTDIPRWVIERAEQPLLNILTPYGRLKENDPEGEKEFDDVIDD
jgi:hypothetical protein